MTRVASPPGKPLLIFDGDCTFCRRWIARWEQKTGEAVDYRPFQDLPADLFPEIPRTDFIEAVHLIEPDGTVSRGARAVFRSLGHGKWYESVPGIAPVSEWVYRLVANHRAAFSFLTRLLWGKDVTRPTYALTREVFLRGLGLIYFIAFVSLWTQLDGLLGSHGIAPVALWREYSEGSFTHNGFGAWLMAPTIFWFGWSDTVLHVACGIGTVLSVCVMAGVGVMPALAGLWILYLSFLQVGDVFLGFQWDALLLETGFLAIWLAPLGWLPRAFRRTEPSRLVVWLLRWLVFRLMFMSGLVKLASGDVTWHTLTALNYHYFTQPLPPWTAWYAQQLPDWLQLWSCRVMFAIELGLPFLIFAGRRGRCVAAAGFVFLMTMISLTGNYCFFNLLTVLLCGMLLDDRALRWLSRRLAPVTPARRVSRWRTRFFAPVAVAILFMTVTPIIQRCGWRVRWPRWMIAGNYNCYFYLSPLHSVNSYGLFAVMTTTRPEIIVEGSNDGESWRAYEFKYKPGDLSRRPRFVWPHQPRLDWQMWFAALGNYQGNPWFINFCARLLEGEPVVLRLLAKNPFPDAPPRYIRAVVYDYQFTESATRQATGQWWRRELKGDYCPTLSLKQGL